MSSFKIGDMVTRTAHLTTSWLEWAKENGDGPYQVVDAQESYITLCGRDGFKGNFIADNFSKVGCSDPTQADTVNSPQHYQFFPGLEAIEVIARSMTLEQFYGFCLGNRLKYRLRAGNKDKLEQDIAKSDKYLELYEQHNGKCIDA